MHLYNKGRPKKSVICSCMHAYIHPCCWRQIYYDVIHIPLLSSGVQNSVKKKKKKSYSTNDRHVHSKHQNQMTIQHAHGRYLRLLTLCLLTWQKQYFVMFGCFLLLFLVCFSFFKANGLYFRSTFTHSMINILFQEASKVFIWVWMECRHMQITYWKN